jgi:hypothetical protein
MSAIFTKFIQLATLAEILEGIFHLHKANGKLVSVVSMDIYVYNLNMLFKIYKNIAIQYSCPL